MRYVSAFSCNTQFVHSSENVMMFCGWFPGGGCQAGVSI